ncbi:MAG: HPr family phosphocarrier protein [Clostridiales bacterium]|jgi:phosphotransferase system HPr (HPr) family protein|nr:HPr family phosphocarrier protein [Clostridiales bacterium]
MVLRELEVKKADGVSSADAQTIVHRAMRYDSEIFFEWRGRKVNAKSLMGVVSMALKCGDKVMAIIKGEDQDEAVEDMDGLFARGFKN